MHRVGLEPTRLSTVVLETTPLTTRAPMLSKEKKRKRKETREKNKETKKKKNDSGRTRTYAPRG